MSVRRKPKYHAIRRICQKSFATVARRWEIMHFIVLIKMKEESNMHMQHTWKSAHPRKRQRNERMKNMYLFQPSHVLSLKEVIFGSWIVVLLRT
jgi:hypothetical protein